MKFIFVLFCGSLVFLTAQEAESGFELRTSISAAGMYSHRFDGAPLTAGFRSMLYPTWKLSQNWTVAGSVQVHSRPYFLEQFPTQGHGVRADILQAHLGYSKFWKDRSLVLRIGQLSSSFGSFLLRYDDADNPLIDMPLTYGYYYKPITSYGLPGAQLDLTLGKLDVRAQFANSSPSNRRSVFDSDQYPNWSGGAGYTFVQGLRIGASAYRGPYLHREFPYFFPGEAKPRDLPATAYGVDIQWARGAWNAQGELQRFRREYRAIPTFTQHAGYAEFRRVMHPRWYIAARLGYLRSNIGDPTDALEAAVGFRPNRHQLIKVGYQRLQTPKSRGNLADSFVVQLVSSLRLLSIARD